ncbi:MAG: gliding motility protein GldN [Dysgonamonadaceae bacterium]|jgi:gliding motility associated protien GldN|nr:gliding motility protein GldN [Dysgonamonadaceae bacterium]
MKPFYYIILIFLSCIFAQDVLSQTQQTPQRRQTPRQRTETENNDLPALSVRAAAKNADQFKNIDNMVWIRDIYRWIDLNDINNSALYFPERPVGDRMNLFTLMFKLVLQGKITGYRYLLDGREIFTDDYKLQTEDMLKNLEIYYTTQGTGAQTKYIVEDSDIPNHEVLMYAIKEVYYFDQTTGMFNTKVTAICPMLVRDEGGEEPARYPLFWLNYEDIRPYISRVVIMTSNLNNALTYTIDDFFNKKMYKGDIERTTNMMNRTLAEEVNNDPEKLKLAQDSIEKQLKFFEEKLWVPEDTTATANKKDSKKNQNKSADKKEKEEKAKKESKPKEQKIETGPTKSVRRTR